jgi:hypothetical protein
MARKSKINYDYKIVYKRMGENKVNFIKVSLPHIRSLAKYCNRFVQNNPTCNILTVFLIDKEEVFNGSVKFLHSEYKNQKFITGWKERLLEVARNTQGIAVK